MNNSFYKGVVLSQMSGKNNQRLGGMGKNAYIYTPKRQVLPFFHNAYDVFFWKTIFDDCCHTAFGGRDILVAATL